MELKEYNAIYECLDALRSEINVSTMPQEDEKVVHPSPDIDIVQQTAEKINSFSVNVFMDAEVNWEEVTMFNLDNIKRLLCLIDNQFLSDVGDAIISAISGKYDPTYPYLKPEVKSEYYDPSSAYLPEDGDWDYNQAISLFVESLKQKRQKAEEYQNKINANKTADGLLYKSAETFVSKLNEDPDFTNKIAIVSKKELEELKKKAQRVEFLESELTKILSDKNEQSNVGLNEKTARGAQLRTGQIIHLVHHAGLADNSKTQEWATVLHLISGCSINTLRQNFNKDDNITDIVKEKVENLYKTTLDNLKQKSK